VATTTPAAESPRTGQPTGAATHREEHIAGYERSPADVLRLIVFGVFTLLAVAATRWTRDGILAVEQDLVDLMSFLTPTWVRILSGVLQLVVALVLALTFVLPLVTRRWRLFGYTQLASAVGGVVMLLLAAGSGVGTLDSLVESSGALSAGFPSPTALAAMVALFVAAGPFVSGRWRRAGAVTLAVTFFLRLIVATRPPVDVLLALGVGAFCGTAILLLFGRPNTHPTPAAVAAALAESGLDIADIHPAAVDARGSTPYLATLRSGDRLFAKVMGTDERSADLLFRMYRALRFRHIGDQRPFSSLRRTVEHEAFVSLLARDGRTRTPRLRAVSNVGADSWLLAYEQLDGTSLDSVPPEDFDDALLGEIWDQIGVLREQRVAHRDLRLANVFLDSDRRVWIIDFGFSEVSADDELLAADVAQMMASLALTVGVDRTVESAITHLGPDAIVPAIGLLQRQLLSGATRERLKQDKGLLDELRARAAERCDTVVPPLEPIQRVKGKAVFTLVMLGAVIYFLIPQLADIPGIFGEIRGANWWLAIPTIIASAVTYVGAAVSIEGSVPSRLPAGPTFAAQVGSSYASKLAPAGLGGMALNLRFLQKLGIDTPVATSAVGLNTVGGILGHVTMLVLFVVWAGRSVFGTVRLPDPRILLFGLGAVVLIALIGMAIRPVRHMVVQRLLPVIGRAGAGLRDVIRRPGKLALLLGGSTVVTLSYITALWFSGQAFGLDLAFARVGAIYLAGSAVAMVAPTPGGLGAVEAALIAGFVAAGVERDIAVPTVFFFRLATFWLPILPGALSFSWLRKHEYL